VSAPDVLARVLLAAGVLAQLLCCVGLWWMRDVFDRLHYAAAGTTAGPVLIGASVAITGFSSPSGTVQTLAALAFLLVLNPLLVHATARAARSLHHGDVRTRAESGADPAEGPP
jgi:monovalent cation/proton antiporter MnhG/PhaG subunit